MSEPSSSRCPWPEGHAPMSWNDVTWPEWVPTKVVTEIVEFWSCFRREPQDYEHNVCSPYSGAVPFGQRVVMAANGSKRPRREGRYVHAWNNVGRLIEDGGRWHLCSDFEFNEAAHARRAEHEAMAPAIRARLLALISDMDPSDLVRMEARFK